MRIHPHFYKGRHTFVGALNVIPASFQFGSSGSRRRWRQNICFDDQPDYLLPAVARLIIYNGHLNCILFCRWLICH